ncbi:GAF domain-containing protein [Azospirillum sp. RWY-5-1]|uniref:GAF domain-containing protein n=1 Tax=Azospirillum oleiclasticum TaxID=2735135 RepID=A0ABX2TEG5_9PROT|nr:GAF domain-containing protein [Azospirillum oleiclasticum]NYZ14963.1 GAF domain-containing protein [Azospirillum oleiclasticum]NYZ22725.1 GAF domain-containing protein [Azospirillum oleiclasticum]
MPDTRATVADDGAAILRKALRLLEGNATPADFEPLAREAAVSGASGLEEDIARAAHVAEQLVHHRKREGELLALYDTARDITALRATDVLLRAIVQRGRRLATADVAYISSLEDGADEFIVRATEGCLYHDLEAMKVPRGYGLCGQVLATRRPCHSVNYLSDYAFDRHDEIDRMVRTEGIVSLLGIPLEIDERVIGVLFVGNRFVRGYTPQEIAILSSLAALAALAIHNSRLFENARRSLANERAVNEQLNQKAAEIQAAGDAHERMVDLIARGGSLEDLAALVAGQLGGRVCITDDRLRARCAAGRVGAGEADPDIDTPQWRGPVRDALRESVATGRSTVAQGPDGLSCRIAAIFGGSDLFGGVLIWHHHALADTEVLTLERSAIVSAIVLLSNERLAHAATRDTYDLVSGLLRGPTDALPGYARGGTKGPSLRWPLTVFLLELGGLRSGQAIPAAKAALAHQGGIVSEYNGDLVALSPAPNPEDTAVALQDAIEEETGVRINVAVSEPAANPAQVPARYQLARRSLRMLRALGHRGRVAHERLFAVYAPLFHGKEEDEIGLFLDRAIGPLRRYDEKRQASLTATLLVYLDHGMKLQRTAEALDIHINTLRQRLTTIRGLSRDWDDPSRLLETHLALKLHALTVGLSS